MNASRQSGKDRLRRIAHDVMRQRGSGAGLPAGRDRTGDSHHACRGCCRSRGARPAGPAVVLDRQRRLARPRPAHGRRASPADAVRILVAIADVDALVPQARRSTSTRAANTTSVYTAAQIFPMLPGEALDGPHVAERGRGPRSRSSSTWTWRRTAGGEAPTSTGRACTTSAKLAYNARRRVARGQAPLPGRGRRDAGLGRAAAHPGPRRRRHAASCGTSTARCELETIEARAGVRRTARSPTCVPEREEPRQGADRGLHDRGERRDRALPRRGAAFRRCAGCCASPERWDRIVALAARSGEQLPAAPDAAALEDVPRPPRQADPLRFPDLSLPSSSCWARASTRVDVPGQDADGHFGLAVSDYTHSTAPNRRFPDLIAQRLLKAALAGKPPPYSRRRAGGAGANTAPSRRTTREGRAPGAQVGGGAAAQLADRRALRRRS